MQQNKNSGTRIAKQTVDTTTNEGSKTMGRGFLNRDVFFPPSFWEGCGEAGGEALFSHLFPMESTPCSFRHHGRLWGHCSPLGNETSHTQGTIWSSLLPPVFIPYYVYQVTNLLSVLAEAPLIVIIYIHRTHNRHCAIKKC